MSVWLSMDAPTETDVKLVELKSIYARAAEKYNVVLDVCDLGWNDETKPPCYFSPEWWI